MINKRGTVLDLATLITIVFASGITIIVALLIMSNINTQMSAIPDLNTTALDRGQSAINYLDVALFFFTFAFIVSTCIAAFYIRTHPAFFIGSLILSFILIFISALFSNIWYEFTNTPSILSTANQFPYTIHIINNLPYIIFGAIIAITVVVYSKSRGSSEL